MIIAIARERQLQDFTHEQGTNRTYSKLNALFSDWDLTKSGLSFRLNVLEETRKGPMSVSIHSPGRPPLA